MEIYNHTDNVHRTWYSGLYVLVKQFIRDYLQRQPIGVASTVQIRQALKSKHPDLLREHVLRSSSNRQPKWQHCIDNALQNMKKQKELRYDRRGKGWRLNNWMESSEES